MSDTPFVLKQVTRTVWIGEPLTHNEIQFLNLFGVNEVPDSTVLLEVSYHLELYRRMCDGTIPVHMELTSEGLSVFIWMDLMILPFGA
jgi:hypothetical protein